MTARPDMSSDAAGETRLGVAISLELALAAACCRWPPTPSRKAAVLGYASRGVNWQILVEVARRHRIEGLVWNGLREAGVDVPSAAAGQLQGAAARIARDNLAFAAESVRLQRMLDAAEVPFLFVKGVTLAQLAYGTLGLKQAWDIDLVVAQHSIGRICALLRDAGYRRIHPGPEVSDARFQVWMSLCKESVWRNDRNGIHVELHNALVDNPLFLAGVGLHSPRQSVQVAAEARLSTLSTTHLFSYLCAHGAGHSWARMKWLADVAALLKDNAPPEIERLYEESLELGAARSAGAALLLCSELFELALPSSLESRLRCDGPTLCLARIALNSMARGDGRTELDRLTFATIPIHLSYFLLVPGWRFKRAEFMRRLVSAWDRVTIPLPRALHFLYPVMLIPRWLMRRHRQARQ